MDDNTPVEPVPPVSDADLAPDDPVENASVNDVTEGHVTPEDTVEEPVTPENTVEEQVTPDNNPEEPVTNEDTVEEQVTPEDIAEEPVTNEDNATDTVEVVAAVPPVLDHGTADLVITDDGTSTDDSPEPPSDGGEDESETAGPLNKPLSARGAQRAATRATKESLITQAELIAMTAPEKTAAREMKALLDQWKRAGHVSKAEDNALWERFNRAQDQLFTRLSLLRDQRRTDAAEAKRRKESLIATAEALSSRADLKEAREAMTRLMAEWKQVGVAPDDKGLWLRFKAAQDTLFARRNQERHQAESDRLQSAALKRSLIAQVAALVGAADLRQANADLRSLQSAFHEAGYAGRDLNKTLADEFRRAQQEFYAWVRKEPVRRRDSGQQPSYDRRTRLIRQIEQIRAEIDNAEKALQTTDPSGAKRSHGASITLTLGETGAYTSAAAQAMRLKITLTDLESQLRSLDSRLSTDQG